MTYINSNNLTPHIALQELIAEIDKCPDDLASQIPKVQEKFQAAINVIFRDISNQDQVPAIKQFKDYNIFFDSVNKLIKDPTQLNSQLTVILENITTLGQVFRSMDQQFVESERKEKINGEKLKQDQIDIEESVKTACKEINVASSFGDIIDIIIKYKLVNSDAFSLFNVGLSRSELAPSLKLEFGNLMKSIDTLPSLIASIISTRQLFKSIQSGQELNKMSGDNFDVKKPFKDAVKNFLCRLDILEAVRINPFASAYELIGFLKHAAKEHSWVAADLCDLYQIKGSKWAVEIAQDAIVNDDLFGNVSRNIHLSFEAFGFNENDRISILRTVIANKQSIIHFDKYQITNAKILGELLVLAACNFDGSVNSWFEANYKLGEEIRKSNSSADCPDSKDQKSLVGSSNYVNITQAERVAIAKTVAAKNGHSLSQHIQYYEISSEEDRYTVAKLATADHPWTSMSRIDSYCLDKSRSLKELVLIAIKKSHQVLYDLISAFAGKSATNNNIKGFADKYPMQPILESTKELNALIKSTDPEEVMQWITCYNWIAIYFEWSLKDYMPYAKQILLFKDPNLRNRLLALLAEFGLPAASTASKESLLLFEIILKPFINAGITIVEYAKIVKILSHSDYEDAVKKEIVLRSLFSLHDCTTLTAAEKVALLKNIFLQDETPASQAQVKEKNAKSVTTFKTIFALQVLESIVLAEKTSLFKQVQVADVKFEADVKSQRECPSQSFDWSKLLNQMFTDMLGLGKIQEFEKKYSATIGLTRNKTALLIYAGKLNGLKDEEKIDALESLKTFAEAVLEGNYKTWRYNLEASEHLQTVFEGREKLLANWKQGGTEEFEKLVKTSKEAASKQFNSIAHLKFNFIDHKHFDLTAYPTLKACIEGTKKCSTALAELAIELIALAKDKPKTSISSKTEHEQDLKVKQLDKKFEVQLITILDPDKILAQKQSSIALFLKTIEGMKKAYKMSDTAFNDLVHITNSLKQDVNAKNNAQIHSDLIVQDTDEWEDLLLCGTEVAASCQRITGDEDKSKCLLGYMSDGKNRLIVVRSKSKNSEIFKPVASCVFFGMKCLKSLSSSKSVFTIV